jgi:hypothetical protein
MAGGSREDSMTEAEWIECIDANRMIGFLLKSGTSRKLRLFTCACCRLRGAALADEQMLAAVETGERYADRLANDDERRAILETVQGIVEKALTKQDWERVAAAADARDCVEVGSQRVTGFERKQQIGRDRYECYLLREIFGNPFRPVTMEPAWLEWQDGFVPKMAKTIYDGRGFEQMPKLADALEAAGCGNEELLGHFRQPRQHIRGCWAVDLVLGKK